MNKRTPLLNDGKIYECNHNRVAVGYLQTCLRWNNYPTVINNIEYEEIIEAFATLLALCVVIVLFPIIPFIRGAVDYNSAVKACKEDDDRRIRADALIDALKVGR